MPRGTGANRLDKDKPSKLTPALAKAKSGIIIKATYCEIACSILTGIGFTMSLFVGNLAFVENTKYIDGVKIGVLVGSLLSTVFGYIILLMSSKK